MKSMISCILIMLVSTSVVSCSKKDNDAGQQQSPSIKEQEQVTAMQVVPVPNQNTLVLSTNDAEQILKKAGFSDSQIQKYGSSIREGLANSGAVRIMIDNVIEAGFAIRGDEVFISSRSKGYFIYNVKTGWVNMPKG